MSRKSADAVRAALHADPNTAKLAAALKMELADYVKLVVHFATTGAEPQLLVVADPELKRLGHTPPDVNQMRAFLTEAVAVKLTHESTSWAAAKSRPVALSAPTGSSAEVLDADPALSAEVQKRRKA